MGDRHDKQAVERHELGAELMSDLPDLADVVTWPQAVVAVVIVLAVVVGPQVVSIIQNRNLGHQFKNNSGSTMRDAVDRIEGKLDALDERVSNLEDNNGR